MSKKKVSAYMIFVSEWQSRSGETNIDKAVKMAAKDWEALDDRAKEEYKLEAKIRNSGLRGRVLDILPPAQQEIKERIGKKEAGIDDATRMAMIEDFCSRPLDEIVNTDFYVVNFNVAVKTKQNAYIPIEVGIVKFSLKEGIQDSYHEFIDGGKTPIGHGYEVKEHMERVHKLPLYDISEYPVTEMAATETQEEHVASLENSIAAFNAFVQAERLPVPEGTDTKRKYVQPLFTLPDLDGLGLTQTSGCLKRMATEVEQVGFYENYEVLDLTYLMFCLYKRVVGKARPMALCMDDFYRVIHSYEPNTNCEYHDTTDTPHCALSRSYRFSYVFLDVLIPVFHIEVTPAHRPKPNPKVEECFLAPMEPRYQVASSSRSRINGRNWSEL